MNADKLRKLAERNEVSVFDRAGSKRTPPFYYDSLRHALGFYFETFNSKNEHYDSYSEGLSKRNVKILKHQLLDMDNTVQSIIAFERFFELFVKDLLRRVDRRLIYATVKLRSANKAQELITKIRSGTYSASKFEGKYLMAPFRETLDRLLGLIALNRVNDRDPIIRKFRKTINKYDFLENADYQATMYHLSWYRDRILHNGNKLPTSWYLDYLISQRVIPLVKEITDLEKDKMGESLFYIQTVTNINILHKISEVKYEFYELKSEKKIEKIKLALLYIGNLKELGRANLNMKPTVRKNQQAAYEYNYKDPIGRAKRFALIETLDNSTGKRIADTKEVIVCPCCGENTMVSYKILGSSLPIQGFEDIDWVKCYLCDFHIRYNAIIRPEFFNQTQV